MSLMQVLSDRGVSMRWAAGNVPLQCGYLLTAGETLPASEQKAHGISALYSQFPGNLQCSFKNSVFLNRNDLQRYFTREVMRLADESVKGCSQLHESTGGTNSNHSGGTISHLWDATLERGMEERGLKGIAGEENSELLWEVCQVCIRLLPYNTESLLLGI